jgi:hypothetical protein
VIDYREESEVLGRQHCLQSLQVVIERARRGLRNDPRRSGGLTPPAHRCLFVFSAGLAVDRAVALVVAAFFVRDLGTLRVVPAPALAPAGLPSPLGSGREALREARLRASPVAGEGSEGGALWLGPDDRRITWLAWAMASTTVDAPSAAKAAGLVTTAVDTITAEDVTGRNGHGRCWAWWRTGATARRPALVIAWPAWVTGVEPRRRSPITLRAVEARAAKATGSIAPPYGPSVIVGRPESLFPARRQAAGSRLRGVAVSRPVLAVHLAVTVDGCS